MTAPTPRPTTPELTVHGELTFADLQARISAYVAALPRAERLLALEQLEVILSARTDGGRRLGLLSWLIARLEVCHE